MLCRDAPWNDHQKPLYPIQGGKGVEAQHLQARAVPLRERNHPQDSQGTTSRRKCHSSCSLKSKIAETDLREAAVGLLRFGYVAKCHREEEGVGALRRHQDHGRDLRHHQPLHARADGTLYLGAKLAPALNLNKVNLNDCEIKCMEFSSCLLVFLNLPL